MLFGIVAALSFIYILTDLVPAYRQKQLLLFWFHIVMTMFAFILAILISLGVTVPSPAAPIKSLLSRVLGY